MIPPQRVMVAFALEPSRPYYVARLCRSCNRTVITGERSPATSSRMQGGSAIDETDIELLPPTTVQSLEGLPRADSPTKPVARACGTPRTTEARTDFVVTLPQMKRHQFYGGRLPFTLSAALTIKAQMIFWHRLRCLGLEAKMASVKCGLAPFPS